MKLNIDKQTLNILKKQFPENKGIRLKVIGFGWAGPKFDMVQDEPKKNDIIEKIDNIDFLVDKDDEFIFNNASIKYVKSMFRSGFQITSASKGIR